MMRPDERWRLASVISASASRQPRSVISGSFLRFPTSNRRITEYGAVPSHRVSRVVAGFRARLGDHREPFHFEIGGSVDNWGQLVQMEDAATD
jgi:hypothetical protein